MKILLVDDNIYILEGLKAGIDYAALGVDEIFVARNIQGATRLLEQENIPLVLTDIEMPGGTGLQLLEWINVHRPETVTLFCTSFADFDYARKAVELHSFDYYLKPIQYDQLQQLLKRAVAEVERRHKTREKELLGEYWLDSLLERKMHFFEDALLHIDSYDEDELELLAKSSHLPYNKADKFTLGLLRFEKEKSRMEGFSGNLERFVMNNMMEELLEGAGVHIETLMKCRKDTWAMVLSHGPGVTNEHICRVFTTIVDAIKDAIRCPVNGYYAYMSAFSNLRSRYMALETAFQDQVGGRTRVVDIDNYKTVKIGYASADMKAWEQLFRGGRRRELTADIEKYLEGRAFVQQMNKQVLCGVKNSVMQMVYTVLWEKQIDAGLLFGDPIYDALQAEALLSVSNLLRYLNHVFTEAMDYMEDSTKEENAVVKVKSYIDQHFCEDITRENLGEIVFLSSGYLAQSFKKETGISLGGYVIEKRMEKARQLLQEGELTVSEVAVAVGYDNFTYFSRLFKTKVGRSPKDYRKSFTSGKTV